MKKLSQILKKKTDCHFHAFDLSDVDALQLLNEDIEKVVCFADIDFKKLDDYKNGEIVDRYKKFIKEYYDESKMILLATATNIEDIMEIYESNDCIKGFGEIKCYDKSKHGKLPFKNKKFLSSVLEYSRSLKKPLPVYVHWSLDNERSIKTFRELVSEYSDVPIVLCHCGMDFYMTEEQKKNASNIASELMKNYSNLWCDVSFAATDYFVANKASLLQFPSNRTLLGSDMNPITIIKHKDAKQRAIKEYEKIGQLSDFVSYENVNRLF